MRKLSLILIVLVAIAVYVAHHQHHVQESTCDDNVACIAAVDAQGHIIAAFNDFRFEKGNCLAYRMTTTDPFKQFCEPYTLKWVKKP
jgi:hypothetical protein